MKFFQEYQEVRLTEDYEEVTIPAYLGDQFDLLADPDHQSDLPDNRNYQFDIPDAFELKSDFLVNPQLEYEEFLELPAKPVRVLKVESSTLPKVQVFRLLPGPTKIEDITVISTATNIC